MKSEQWEDKKEERKKKALKEHERLSKLFRENRFAFERERKRMIDEIINSAKDEELRDRLRDMQRSWDKKMKGAGSEHNRFVLAHALFWKHLHEVWQPAIQKFSQFSRF